MPLAIDPRGADNKTGHAMEQPGTARTRTCDVRSAAMAAVFLEKQASDSGPSERIGGNGAGDERSNRPG